MDQLFLNMIKISVITSVIILLVIIFTPLIKRNYSNRWRYFLWLFLCIMLIVPMNISSPKAPITIQSQNIELYTRALNVEYTVNPQVEPSGAEEEPAEEIAYSPLVTIKSVILIWITGGILFLLWNIVSYLRYKKGIKRWCYKSKDEVVNNLFKEVKKGMEIKKDIRLKICENIDSPMLLGLFKPIIVVPNNDFSYNELNHIFTHELTHYKRGDIAFKMLLLITKSVHWFNPFIHLMGRMASADIEICCDTDVTENRSMHYKENYIKTILTVMKLNRNREVMLSTHFNGGKRMMEERIKTLFSSKRHKKGFIILACAVLFILGGQFLVACTDSNIPINEPDTKVENVNQALGYAITLPEGVEGRVQVNVDGETIYITSKMIQEKDTEYPGIVLFIYPMAKTDFPERKDLDNYIENEAPVPFNVIGETKDNYIGYSFASDVQYPVDNNELIKEFNDLVTEIKNKGIGFRVLSEEELSDKLTLEIVQELAKKGDELSWKDFQGYYGREMGSGLYIMEYPIDDNYVLLVGGGNPKEKPIYIKLVDGNSEGIDIRHEDIEEFIKNRYIVIGYIKDFDASSNTIKLDEIEWLTLEDTERLEELQLDANEDLPSGFIIYNESEILSDYKLKDNAKFKMLDYADYVKVTETDREGFITRIEDNAVGSMLVRLTIKDSLIIDVTEQYVP